MKNKVISKQTWSSLFAIKNYQDFIQEWLALYDSFFAVNPKIPHELEMDCMLKLTQGFVVKHFAKCTKNDDYMNLHDFLQAMCDDIQEVVNPYESK